MATESNSPKVVFYSSPINHLGPGTDTLFRFPTNPGHVIESIRLKVSSNDPQNLFADIPRLLGNITVEHHGKPIGTLHADAILLLGEQYGLEKNVSEHSVEFELPLDFHPKLGGIGVPIQPFETLQLIWRNCVSPTDSRGVDMTASVAWTGHMAPSTSTTMVTTHQTFYRHGDANLSLYFPGHGYKAHRLAQVSIIVAQDQPPTQVLLADSTWNWQQHQVAVPHLNKHVMTINLSTLDIQRNPVELSITGIKGTTDSGVYIDVISRWL